MNGHGHDFGHEFVSESVSEADSDTDTRFFGTSDTHSDTDMAESWLQTQARVRTRTFPKTSDMGSDSDMTSDTCVRSSLPPVKLERYSRFGDIYMFSMI